jgi:hypothetical protein
MLRADASAAQRFRLAKISSVAIWARRQQKLQQPFDRNQLPQQQSEAPANAAVMSGQDKVDAAQDPPRGPCVPARRPIFLLTGLPTPRTPTKNPLRRGWSRSGKEYRTRLSPGPRRLLRSSSSQHPVPADLWIPGASQPGECQVPSNSSRKLEICRGKIIAFGFQAIAFQRCSSLVLSI